MNCLICVVASQGMCNVYCKYSTLWCNHEHEYLKVNSWITLDEILSMTQMLAPISDSQMTVDSQSAKQVKDDFQFILCTLKSVLTLLFCVTIL